MSAEKSRQAERGNALFYILVAVALLAALSFAIAQSNRGRLQQIDDDRARLLATEMIEYGNILVSATSQLRLRGCADTELSFENTGLAGHVNNDAPADNTCHIFHVAGGGVHFTDIPEDAKESGTATWVFSSDMEVEEVGTTCAADSCTDLLMMALEVNDTVCRKINELLGITDPATIPSQSDAEFVDFTHTNAYTYDDTIGDEAGTSNLVRTSAGCFDSGLDGFNIFYQVLLSR